MDASWDGETLPLQYKLTSDATWCALHKRRKHKPLREQGTHGQTWVCNVCDFLERHGMKEDH